MRGPGEERRHPFKFPVLPSPVYLEREHDNLNPLASSFPGVRLGDRDIGEREGACLYTQDRLREGEGCSFFRHYRVQTGVWPREYRRAGALRLPDIRARVLRIAPRLGREGKAIDRELWLALGEREQAFAIGAASGTSPCLRVTQPATAASCCSRHGSRDDRKPAPCFRAAAWQPSSIPTAIAGELTRGTSIGTI